VSSTRIIFTCFGKNCICCTQVGFSSSFFPYDLYFSFLFICYSSEPILLIGLTSYKTLIVHTWTVISDRTADLQCVHLTSETESTELIGQIQLFVFTDLLLSLPKQAWLIFQRYQVLKASNNNDENTAAIENDACDFIEKFTDEVTCLEDLQHRTTAKPVSFYETPQLSTVKKQILHSQQADRINVAQHLHKINPLPETQIDHQSDDEDITADLISDFTTHSVTTEFDDDLADLNFLYRFASTQENERRHSLYKIRWCW
jgi:hypothetical protein